MTKVLILINVSRNVNPTPYVRNVLWRNLLDNLPINPVDFVSSKDIVYITLCVIFTRLARN